MTRYYKLIEGAYIIAIGTGLDGEEITKEEYDAILDLIIARPVPDAGYDYILKTDMTWELVEVPVVEEEEQEISDSEALNIILGGEG